MKENEAKLMDKVWQYPLFEAFARRRTHRFPFGVELKDTPFPYKSEKKPVPLSELETALACWAGHGTTGLILGDLEVTLNNYMSWTGRTHPQACNDDHVDLIFINDEGVFLYRSRPATQPVEFKGPGDREKILTMFREDTVKLQSGRPSFPPASMLKLNVWNANKPGQTVFFPVVNLTYEYINFLFLSFCDDRYQIIDDRTGKPAGIKKWIDNGYLNGPQVPLTMNEIGVMNVVGGSAHYSVQNMNLACGAIGLGSFVWAGFLGLVFMGGTPLTRGLGFRFVTGKDGMPTPVGLDKHIEGLCPPYFKSMDDVVDHVVNLKFGPKGLFSEDYPGKRVWRDPKMATRANKLTEEGIACAKAYCKYVYETYGRFPAFVDAIQMPVAMTAHHLDLDFYDKYYPAEVITPAQREHMRVWHGAE